MGGRVDVERAIACAREVRRIRHPRRGVWQKVGASLGAMAPCMPAAGERLLELSRHQSAGMRRRAVFGLAAWSKQDDRPVEALAALAQDPDPAVCRSAAGALGRAAARSGAALDHLRACARADSILLRAGAAGAFGYLLRRRTREALETLSPLVEDDDASVRAAVAAALALSPRRAADQALAMLAALVDRCAFSTDPSGELEALIAALGMLARYRPRKVLAVVRRMAACALEVCRWFAAQALGAQALAGQPGVRALAEAAARDPMHGVQEGVLRAIRRNARWAPARWQMTLVRRLLKDHHRLVRAAAAETVGVLAAAFPLQGLPLLSALVQHDDAYLRMGAAHAAGDAASAEPGLALEALGRLASDGDGGVRRAAAVALGGLAADHADEAGALLCRLMGDPDAPVRSAAVRASRALPAERAAQTVEALLPRATDVHPQVRRAAVEALYYAAAIMPESCAEAAMTLLPDDSLRPLAIAALAEASAALPAATMHWLLQGLGACPDARFLDLFAACHPDEDAAALALAMHEATVATDYPAAIDRLADRVAASERLGGGTAAAVLWRLAADFLRVRTLEDLVALAPTLLQSIEAGRTEAPAANESNERLAAALRLAMRGDDAPTGDDRLRDLTAAKAIMDDMLAGPAPWTEPLRLRGWREALLASSGALGGAIETVRFKAVIEARLESRQAVRKDLVPLLVSVENTGSSPAQDVRIEVSPTHGCYPTAPPPALPALHAGERRYVEVTVRLEPGMQHLRVAGHVSYSGAQHEGRRAAFEGHVALVDPAKPFQPVENPYLPGKPLASGSPMFFGRQPMLRFVKSALAGATQSNVVVLWGQRRIGKTSILKQIGAALGDGFFPVFIDVQGLLADGMPAFLHELAWHAARSLREVGVGYEVPAADDLARSPHLLSEQLAQVMQAAGGRRLVFLLDEFDDLDYKVNSGLLPPMVFDHLRHIMQHVPDCAFVLSGARRIQELAGNYWSFLFSLALHRRIAPLMHEDALELVTRPMSEAGIACEDLAAARICLLTGGHPYLTQLACHMLVEECNEEQRLVVAGEHVDEMAEELLEWGETHLRYWWDTASAPERAVLAMAAEQAEAAEAITGEAVARRLAAGGVTLDTAVLEIAVARLMEKDLLHTRGHDSGVFRLCTGLARRWVRTHWPLDRAAHALRAGEWADESGGRRAGGAS